MRIALLFPPYTHKVFSENLRVVDEEFCIAPPILLAYVASMLEKEGHTVMILDAHALKATKEDALRQLKTFEPEALGFRAETYYFYDALPWIKYLKEHLKVPVFAGGINLSLYPKETMSHCEIDFGICGNGLLNTGQLITAIENNTSFADIPNILYRRGSEIITTQKMDDFQPFENYPMPARHLLPNELYYSFVSQKKNFSIMLTSIGCPSQCKFCAIPASMPFSQRSAEKVVEEMDICYKKFGIREIDIFDGVFFLNKERCLKIFKLMKAKGLHLDWTCRSRVDLVDEEILRNAAECGCRQINYGIESGDEDILNRTQKGISQNQIMNAIALTRKHGIRTMGFFMVGNEGETVQSVRKSITFAKKLKLDYVQVCQTIPKPGAKLTMNVVKLLKEDPWKRHLAGKPITKRLPVVGTELTEKQIKALTKEFYIKFYFRISIVAKRILECQSLGEFIRYLRVAWRMMFVRK